MLVTPGQPALNPRLVKEADALANAGYKVTVCYSYWNAWGDTFNKQMLITKKWEAVCIGGHPVNEPVKYLLSRIIHGIAKYWAKNNGPGTRFLELAAARSSYFLIKEVHKHKADLYIAHNLGALAAVAKAAKKNSVKWGFDAEDYHRYEAGDDEKALSFKIAKSLEDKYLEQANYITASSPLIGKMYAQLYPNKKPVIIRNVFPLNKAVRKLKADNAPVKIFWFSQTIGAHRGLKAIARALAVLNPVQFELHLLGYIDNEKKAMFVDTELAGITNVCFHNPVLPDELIGFAAQFDIGLAAELSQPLNRDVCLTNKLFTYLQAGLTILASDTTAQQMFFEEYPQIGTIYKKDDTESLINALTAYQLNRKALLNTGEASLKLATEKLNWETESQYFLTLVKQTLSE